MAEGLPYGRANYPGKANIGERDESFAGRADAIAEKNGWVIDTARLALHEGRGIESGGPVTDNRVYFWPLQYLDRDYVLTEGRCSVQSAGDEAQQMALYYLDGKTLRQLPGSLVSFTANGATSVSLPTEVILRRNQRYYVGASSTSGTGAFIMWRSGDPGVQFPYLTGPVPPREVALFELEKTNPERVPYTVYLSKEASLVL
jgi:hypothetical protein